MKSRNSTFRPTLLAAIGLLSAATAAPCFAQSVEKPYPYEEDDIVVVPYGIQRYETGRNAPGSIGREEVLSLSRIVTTDGLDLRYDPDVAALHQRVEYTAREICRDLDRASAGQALTSDRECVRDAVRDAEPQVEHAVWRARTYASLK